MILIYILVNIELEHLFKKAGKDIPALQFNGLQGMLPHQIPLLSCAREDYDTINNVLAKKLQRLEPVRLKPHLSMAVTSLLMFWVFF